VERSTRLGLENTELLRGFIGALPDLHAAEQDLIAAGETVAVRLVVDATHDGNLLGIPPTGRRLHWDAVDIYRFADGMIVEEWAADDMTAVVNQVATFTPPWLAGRQTQTTTEGVE